MKRHALSFGLVGGLLIAALQYTQRRFLVVDHSFERYGALVAILFSALGIWLGIRLTRRQPDLPPAPQPTAPEPAAAARIDVAPSAFPQPETAASFSPDRAQQKHVGITERELEVLTLVAGGFSNREIAQQLFVSENTVKTHCARAYEKLGVSRRTQAVQRGKQLNLLP